MGQSSDLQEAIRKEKDRLDQINFRESVLQKRREKWKKWMLGLGIFIIIVSLIFGINLFLNYNADKKIAAFVNAYKEKSKEVIPILDLNGRLEKRAKHFIDNEIRLFNHGEIDYASVYDDLSALNHGNITAQLEDYIELKRNHLGKLDQSKRMSYQAEDAEDDDNYLEAVKYYAMVVEEDTLFKTARKRISSLKDSYYSSLLVRIVHDLDYSTKDYKQLILEAIEFYPQDKKIEELKNSLDDCGNPLYYAMADVIIENIKMIEKDDKHTKAECTSIQLTYVSETKIILEAYFHENQSNACIYSYIVEPMHIEKIDRKEYVNTLYDVGETKNLKFSWDNSAANNTKKGTMYENLIKFGMNYDGNTTDLHDLLIDSTEMLETENETKSQELNLGIIVLGEAIAVLIVILIMRSLFVSMFRR